MTALLRKAFAPLHHQLQDWLLRDKHKTTSLTLGHSTVYVLPSKLGFGFILVAALNFILAANYQNNLVQLSSYLMLVLVLMSLIQSYANIKGLQLQFKEVASGYANQERTYRLSLANQQRNSYAIQLQWQGSTTLVEKVEDSSQDVSIQGGKQARGYYKVPRLKVFSTYPFGLAKVWSYLDANADYYVYPAPQPHNHGLSKQALDDSPQQNSGALSQSGNDEFDGLKEHKQLADYRRISWKHFAKREQLLVKEFITEADGAYVVDFEKFPGDVENRLSLMAYSIEQAQIQHMPIAIALPGLILACNNSDEHYLKALRALALYKKRGSHHE
ncbi:DUF58 domain-containing protein [Pseudoalteromonas sp. T1lg10]|uniref:DUF58 domain-containing protein n=1 Tax=Pseudoalteromonas sp. T1lg10 TaxID=2077093 RepID=UPI001319E98E|nr:DUF58 domain-containing protein [Pseudoalteromonas sp. T1lg10]